MNEKLEKWADLLLDTGKRNNLVNYKDTKSTTLDIIAPRFVELFGKADSNAVLEAIDPLIDYDGVVLTAQEVYERFASKLKSNRVIVYSASGKPLDALNVIGKRARTAIEETGVNIAYAAFGFINWTENENSRIVMRAPILLAPVTILHESSVDPYKIRIIDDIVVNPTFAFKLQSEYGIALPEFDDNAVEYLNKVGELLAPLNWTVTDEVKIGIFSFLKINMYTDLKDNENVILKNNAVRAMLGEPIAVNDNTDGAAQYKAFDIDDQNNVVDADSSQAEAIEMAKAGKSFVLQGPPGTGKSQTITNIIAERLADGKKVLFVSEKLAALSVVYEKLKRAGLEEFCLELHSHKSNKKIIIDELCRTLKKSRSGVSERAQRELDTKRRLQEKLDGYSVELHKVRPVINKTLYGLFEEYSACRNSPSVEFVLSDISRRGEDFAERAESILSRYAAFMPSVGNNYRDNIWYGYNKAEYSYEGVMRLKSDLNALCVEVNAVIALRDRLKVLCGIDADSIKKAIAASEFLKVFSSSEFFTRSLFGADIGAVKKSAERLAELARTIEELRIKIDAVYSAEVYGMDVRDIYNKLTRKYGGAFSRLFGGEYKRIMNELKSHKLDGKRPKYKEAVAAVRALVMYKENRDEYDSVASGVAELLGGGYKDITTDFNKLNYELVKLNNLLNGGMSVDGIYAMTDGEYAAARAEFQAISDGYAKTLNEYAEHNKRVAASFDKAEYDVMSVDLDGLKRKMRDCANGTDRLDNWCEFVRLLKLLADEGLSGYIDEAIRSEMRACDIVTAFKKLFYSQWIDGILRSSPILVELTRLPHDEAVKVFAEKDRLNFEINKAKIKAALSEQRPVIDMVAPGSSVAVLLREGEKKRKQKGVRQLLSEIGDLAQVIKPCFLMSPLSVSTFLSADTVFDVVIFDEASQIFPQDAVGAIYRGKQLIVVGDSKQMPPTNFFNNVADDRDGDDDADDITDFESVLDICAATLPQCRLKWHYRSRYEQLIAFSNRNFYDGELITFPSAKVDRLDVGVDYYKVNGTFDRKSKTNLAEAERVADLVFEHIEKHPDRSLGVVAFGIAQQGLIDRVIAKRRQKDTSKDEFFRSDREEPFFVKNLETVQGDERDTVIFSVAYAPDASGKLLLNFGPVNRMGGERRLNVAVTRAKSNVKLVTSLTATDIDISRAKSEGARLLREYLDYAEHGEIALSREPSVNGFDGYGSEFESEVCEYLRNKGFSVDTQVGCSSFKIDLAVKRPDTSDYVLAVECDGLSYHSSKSTRDRDRLRQEILERMGWRFYRIWSTDWFRNKAEEQQRLLSAAMAAFDNVPVRPFKESGGADKAEDADMRFAVVAETEHFKFPEYNYVDAQKAARSNRRDFMATVLTVLKSEAPLSEEWLIKRMAFMFGREKVSTVVTRSYYSYMNNCDRYNITRRDGFLYLDDTDVVGLRVPPENSKDAPREVKYICLEELASGILAVLRQNVTAEKQGLYKVIASKLGFSRLSAAMTERFDRALDLVKNQVAIDGNMISLKK